MDIEMKIMKWYFIKLNELSIVSEFMIDEYGVSSQDVNSRL